MPRKIQCAYLPVDSITIYVDWLAFLGGGLAEALEQDEDTGCLLVGQPRVLAENGAVELDADVGRAVRVEWRYHGV